MADLNSTAFRIVKEATDPDTPRTRPTGDNRGTSGGKARAEKLSPERRSEIAKTAAKSRWERKAKMDKRAERAAKQAAGRKSAAR